MARLAGAIIATALVASGCTTEDLVEDLGSDDAAPEKVAASVARSVDDGADTVALVVLDLGNAESLAPSVLDARHMTSVSNALAAWPAGDDDARARAVETRAALYAAVGKNLAAGLAADVSITRTYPNLPVVAVRVRSRDGLAALAERPEVARVDEDRAHQAHLTQSLALIHQPAAAAAGSTGAGTTVAVLDTGLDYTRSAFGTCPSPGVAGCKVAFAADFAPDDGALDDVGHGTNVSGIVLGVAPGARVAALDVFNGSSAPSSAILAAVDWSIQNRATYNIAAMNLSLGSGLYTAACGHDIFASALANARAAGIVPVVSSGNAGATSAMAAPACVPAAVSVGAVYDAALGPMTFSGCSDGSSAADKIPCFSSSASFLSVLAPGALITAAGITMAGTSQASPHVAGAVAVLRAAKLDEPVDALVSRITGTGPVVVDPRNGVSTHRLDLQAALGLATAPDRTAPVGRLELPTATRSNAITASLPATDAVGVTSMCITNGTTCSAWTAYAPTKTWTLASGDGTKTVRVWFKDAAGNVSAVASDTIVLDTRAPTDGSVTASPRDAAVLLSWTGHSDTGSGIASFVVVSAPTTAPASCKSGTVRYTGGDRSVELTGLTNGANIGFRLCAVDAVGNTSPGKVVVTRPAPELAPPVANVAINDGDLYTRAKAVRLTILASDASRVASMCVSNTTSCSAWVPYAASYPWTLTKLAGPAVVSVWLRDEWGNTTPAATTATITVDMTAPRMGTVTGIAVAGKVTLTWTAATDATTAVAAYRLVYAPGTTAPASCSAGILVYVGTVPGFNHGPLPAGSYAYRLCATDVVGNTATGVVKTFKLL